MTEYKFKQDQPVFFDTGTVKGIGTITGIAANEIPLIGASYIVRVNEIYPPLDNYPFNCIAIFEIHIEPIK